MDRGSPRPCAVADREGDAWGRARPGCWGGLGLRCRRGSRRPPRWRRPCSSSGRSAPACSRRGRVGHMRSHSPAAYAANALEEAAQADKKLDRALGRRACRARQAAPTSRWRSSRAAAAPSTASLARSASWPRSSRLLALPGLDGGGRRRPLTSRPSSSAASAGSACPSTARRSDLGGAKPRARQPAAAAGDERRPLGAPRGADGGAVAGRRPGDRDPQPPRRDLVAAPRARARASHAEPSSIIVRDGDAYRLTLPPGSEVDLIEFRRGPRPGPEPARSGRAARSRSPGRTRARSTSTPASCSRRTAPPSG